MPPPQHTRVSMLASPCWEGEREPRWVGQYDAVAGEHMFVNRRTETTRRGPWVSMRASSGRMYYLSLHSGASRWDPPPLWGKDWVLTPAVCQYRFSREPVAVAHHQEVCGGAQVDVDLLAVLQSSLEPLMVEPDCTADVRDMSREEAEYIASSHDGRSCDRMRMATVREQVSRLLVLRSCFVRQVQQRFALGGLLPAISLHDVCPEIRTFETLDRDFEGADHRRGCYDMTVQRGAAALLSLRGMGSSRRLAEAWLPAILANGGFCE